MATQNSTSLGPPPIQTPLTAHGPDEIGIPWQNRQAQGGVVSSNLNVSWAAWFNATFQRVLSSPKLLSATQSQLAAIAATLGGGDSGLLVNVTDYAHILQWTGSAWTWGPGEQGSGMMALFEVDPTGSGWHLYDGATVNYLKADGTTGSVTLPNLAATAAYTKAGSPNSGPNAAVAPTITTPANTGSHILTIAEMPAHDHTYSSLKFDSNFAPGGLGAVTNAGLAVPNVDSTGGGGGHTHTLSAVTSAADAEPRNLVRRPWFRQ